MTDATHNMAGILQAVAVGGIDAGDRLRPVDPAKVQLIADGIQTWRAMGNSGIPAPITLRPSVDGNWTKWKLVAGAHRLAAVKLLGDDVVDAIIHDLNDHQARLVEIDENLCRNELNALDRAAFLAERDRIWREMYPDKAGRKGSNKARWHGASDPSEKFSFGSDAQEKTGLSQRSIQADVKLYRLLAETPEVIERVRGTWLEDNQQQLKALAKLTPEDRGQVLDRLFREESPAKNVGAAIVEVSGRREQTATPDEEAFAALVKVWTRAGAKVRGRFLDHLNETGALDTYINGSED